MELFCRPDCHAAQRVRVALKLKAIPFVDRPMEELEKELSATRLFSLGLGAETQGPVLLDRQRVLTQSLAIVEYLDELFPEPVLIPAAARDRARVHALAELAAFDTQSLTDLRVLAYLRDQEGFDEMRLGRWSGHWLESGLRALERMLRGNPATGSFCHGDSPTLADLCLVPLVMDALQRGIEMTAYPTVVRIHQQCMTLEAFAGPA